MNEVPTGYHLPEDVDGGDGEGVRDGRRSASLLLQRLQQAAGLLLHHRHHPGFAHAQVPQLTHGEAPVVLPHLTLAPHHTCRVYRQEWPIVKLVHMHIWFYKCTHTHKCTSICKLTVHTCTHVLIDTYEYTNRT